MAITRLFETGLEWNEILLEWTANVGTSLAIATSQVKSGVYSLQITGSASTTYVYKVLPASIAQARVSLHMRHGLVNSTNTPDVITLTDNSTNVIRIRWNGSAFIAVAGSTTLATVISTGFAPINSWQHLSLDVKIHASAGWVKLYCEGNLVINYSGKTDYGSTTFNRLNVGPTDSQSWSSASNQYYDDIYLDDTTGEVAATFTPDRRFYFIGANGNGFYSQMVGVDLDNIDNYLQVDELPQDGDTTHVEVDTANQRDSYAMTTFTLPVGWTIEAVIPQAVSKKDDAGGTLGLQLGTRLASVNAESGTITLGTSYRLQSYRQELNPSGDAWDQDGLDSLQVIVKSAL